MSGIYDIFKLQDNPSTASTSEHGADTYSHSQENIGAPEAPPGNATNRIPRQTVQVPNVPTRWALEVQKIAFLLSQEEEAERPMRIVFSSLQRKSGTTTISYLVANYLATERGHKAVLYVNFSTDSSSPARDASNSHVTVGQDKLQNLFNAEHGTLSWLSIRPGKDRSAAVTSRWFQEFMTESEKFYDIIIIDTPPFSAAPESFSLARASDGVVLILKCGETRYPAVNALVSDLAALGITTLGAVMNHRRYPIPRWLLKYV